jgi:hypothetical protein
MAAFQSKLSSLVVNAMRFQELIIIVILTFALSEIHAETRQDSNLLLLNFTEVASVRNESDSVYYTIA